VIRQRLTIGLYFHSFGNMESNVVINALFALAQESRLAVFRLLVRTGAKGMAAGQIGELLNLPAPTLSFHLAQLSQAGLVKVRREGRSLIYAADYATMNALMGFLTDNCCAGDAAACAPSSCAPQAALSPVREGERA
jgi:ArsR family transcriptional regulator, arsenate/arsenite/antimonite-responsive transcriptional repressor